MMSPRDLRRFVSFIHIDDRKSCWEWAGTLSPDGYGHFFHNERTSRAHRVAYEIFKEPIPPTLTIDHLCRNRKCVNPWHLEAVSIRENTLRGEGRTAVNASKTHCKHGHLFDAENTYYDTSRGSPMRVCRECQRRRSLDYYHRKKLATIKGA